MNLQFGPFALAALLLTGCATLPQPPAQGNRAQAEQRWSEHRAAVSAIRGFELRGRIAGSALGASADVVWQQSANGRFEIRVSGPFGSGAMTLRGDDSLVEVTTRDGSISTAQPELWLQQHLGWTLPIAGLRWWALGLPAPRSAARLEIGNEGRVVKLAQDGWQLQFSEYVAIGSWQLPRRLEASQGELRLRVLADQWNGLNAP